MVTATVQDQTNQEALVQAAKAHGFVEVRATTAHWFIKKGTANFKVPKREPVNEHMRAAINRIIAEVDQRAHRSPGSQGLLPLAVNYKNETYAVVQKNATQYQIQDLDKGVKQWVDKAACDVVTDDVLRAMPDDPLPEADLAAAAEAALPPPSPILPPPELNGNGATAPEEPSPPAAPRSMLDDLEDIDPMAYWVRMTQRQIDNYTSQIDAAMAKIQPVIERRDALVAAMAAASGKPVTGSAVRHVKLGMAPTPGKAKTGTSKRYAPEKIAQVKELLRQGRDNAQIETATGVAASTVSYYRNKAS